MDTLPFQQRLRITALLFIFSVLIAGCGKSVKQKPDTPKTGQPPTVEAGEDFFVEETTPIVLGGSASSESRVISYKWEQKEGSTIATELSGQNSVSASFLAPKVTRPQILTFQFTVETAAGGVGTDEVKVIVNPVNTPPNISYSETYNASEQTWLNIDTQISDPDGSITDIQWTQISGQPVELIGNDKPSIRLLTPPASETEEIILEVLAIDNEEGFTRKQIAVTVAPVFIPPTIADLKPINTNAYNLVTLTANVDDIDGTTTTTWRQLSGAPVNLQTGQSGESYFVAPNVEVTEILEFEITAVDEDTLETRKKVTVNILPAEFVTIPAVISYAPELLTAQIEARRVFRNGLKSQPHVLEESADEFGFFTLSLPGHGLYEITSKNILLYPGTSDLSNDLVELAALVNTSPETSTVNISVLTHLTHQRIFSVMRASPQLSFDEAKIITEDQLRNALVPVISTGELRDFSSLGIYQSLRTEKSSYLSALTAITSWYALSRSTSEHLYKEVSLVLAELLDDFSIDGKIDMANTALQGMIASQKEVDTKLINTLLQVKTIAQPDIEPSDVESHFDSDQDGVVNALDFDDDNDGITDENDAFPLGPRFMPTGCQIRNRLDPRTVTSDRFNIANLWKRDQHLNYKSSTLQAGPLISQHDSFAEWEITRVGDSNSYTIKNTDSGSYLALDTEKEKNVHLLEGPIKDDSYYWEFIPDNPSNENPIFFHIQNVQQANYQLKITGTSEPDTVYGAFAGVTEASGALSPLWSFCTTEIRTKHLESYTTPNNFPETPCTQKGAEALSDFETDVYLIQNAWRPSQYLNRAFGLNSSPIISPEAPSNQWIITPKFGTDLLYIQSNSEDKVYLGIHSAGDKRISLDRKPRSNDDSFLWHFDRIVPGSTYLGYRIHNAGHQGYYLETDPGTGSSPSDIHNVRIRAVNTQSLGALALHWLTCKASGT